MINILTGIKSTSSALNAERIRMEVVAQNIANANVKDFQNGQPYQRQVVHFDHVLQSQMGGSRGAVPESIQVARIEKDQRPFEKIFNSVSGKWESMPNVNIQEEWVDHIAASRTYEANLAVVKNARSMANQTLQIGKRA
jgi:flagellar basal-body rod protein FlgC